MNLRYLNILSVSVIVFCITQSYVDIIHIYIKSTLLVCRHINFGVL